MKLITAAMILFTLFPAVAMATGSPSNSNGPRKGGDSTSNSASISGAASKAEARAASASKSSSRSKSSATGGNAAAVGGAGGNSAGGSAVASVAPMSFSFTAQATPSASFVQHDTAEYPSGMAYLVADCNLQPARLTESEPSNA